MSYENDPTLNADDAPGTATTPHDVATVLADRYEIVALLGTGGMGCVYRAADRELGENVALKVLHADMLASPDAVERFREEVRLARRVTHRNVARTFDIGEHQGEKFLTMELVAGQALSGMLERRGVLGVAEALAIATQVCDGMAAAHDVGVIHRDLKPDNVLVDADGRAVITDFGIARSDSSTTPSRTLAGRLIGTPAYMAPEQVEAAETLDGRADIYAFGAMLYEMITGRRAWPGDNALAVATARLVKPPPDPRSIDPAIDSALASLVVRCLAQKRDDRFATARELANELATLHSPSIRPPPRLTLPVPAALPSREKTVVVASFRNLGAPDDAHLAEGITEDLVDTLAMTRGLRVRSHGAADVRGDIVEIARRLDADVVVEGSVRCAGGALRVNARVVSVADGFQLWGGRFDRAVEAAFAVNDEVASAIARVLSAEDAPAPRGITTDPRAIELYFRARRKLSRFYMTEFPEVIDLFSRALELAPDDPTILAGYVAARARSFFSQRTEPAPMAKLIRRALAAAPQGAEPWVALATIRWNTLEDVPAAARAARRAVLHGPSVSDAHDIAGRVLLEVGQIEEAKPHLERALWLDPHTTTARVELIRIAAFDADWDRARALAMAPEAGEFGQRSATAQRLALWRGAPVFDRTPVPPDAVPRLRLLQAIYDEVTVTRRWLPTYEEGFVSAAEGIPNRAQALLGQLAAEIACACGEPDVAVRWIDRAVRSNLVDLTWLDRLSLLAPARAHPAFAPLRAEVAARSEAIVAAWRGAPESVDAAIASLDAIE